MRIFNYFVCGIFLIVSMPLTAMEKSVSKPAAIQNSSSLLQNLSLENLLGINLLTSETYTKFLNCDDFTGSFLSDMKAVGNLVYRDKKPSLKVDLTKENAQFLSKLIRILRDGARSYSPSSDCRELITVSPKEMGIQQANTVLQIIQGLQGLKEEDFSQLVGYFCESCDAVPLKQVYDELLDVSLGGLSTEKKAPEPDISSFYDNL